MAVPQMLPGSAPVGRATLQDMIVSLGALLPTAAGPPTEVRSPCGTAPRFEHLIE